MCLKIKKKKNFIIHSEYFTSVAFAQVKCSSRLLIFTEQLDQVMVARRNESKASGEGGSSMADMQTKTS